MWKKLPFIFDTKATFEDSLLHIVTLYNNNLFPCLPLSPCTDNDCIWLHSFIFYIIVGASVCFLGLFICCSFWNGFDGSLIMCGRVCVCVRQCASMVYACERERKTEKRKRLGVLFSGSVFSSQCTSVLCSSLCQRVQVFPLHPFIQKKVRTRESGRWRREFFPQGETKKWEKILLRKYFSPLRGTKKTVNF